MTHSPEQVDKVEVSFGTPKAGWIRLTLSTATQKITWPLSDLYDPFVDDFTNWLEAIVDQGHGSLIVDVEGNYAQIHVLPTSETSVRVIGKSIYESKPDFEIEISRYRFVHDFYSSMVAFWESDELKRNWDEWVLTVKDPDWRLDFPPEIQRKLEQPHSIRSQKVERFLQPNTSLKRVRAWLASRRRSGPARSSESDPLTQSSEYLFVYGTLGRIVGHEMHQHLVRHADYEGEGIFNGILYRVGHYPGAVASPDPDDIVHGELYRLRDPDALFAALDPYEGCGPDDGAPTNYVRVTATIHGPGGGTVVAWIYRYNGHVTKQLARIASGRF